MPDKGDVETAAVPGDLVVSDSDLLALILRGDVEALGVVYDRHIEALWKVAVYYAPDAAAAERGVFAVFQRLWRQPRPTDPTSLRVRLLWTLGRELVSSHDERAHPMSSGLAMKKPA